MNSAAWLTWGQTMKESSKKSKATDSLIHTCISNLFLQLEDETNLRKKKKGSQAVSLPELLHEAELSLRLFIF